MSMSRRKFFRTATVASATLALPSLLATRLTADGTRAESEAA